MYQVLQCLHSGCFPDSGGSKVRASGRCSDTLAFNLIKRCDPLISASSIMLTFRLTTPRYKADTSSLKHLVKVSNYWCHPDSLFTRLSQVGWVTAHGTGCRLPNIIRTQCKLIRRKTGECMWGDCMELSACSSSTCCNSAKKLRKELNMMGIIISIISVTSISRLSVKNLKPLIGFSTAVVAQGSWVLWFLVTHTKRKIQ